MKKFTGFLLSLAILLGLICVPGVLQASAAEDNTPPELVDVRVLQTSVTAGDAIQVSIKVRESETGLAKASVQFNHVEDLTNGTYPIKTEMSWETPLYSSDENYIEYTFNVTMTGTMLSGDWYIGYVELYDQKGNYSAYAGNRNDNTVTRSFVDSFEPFEGVTHVQVTSDTGDAGRPVINSATIKNSTVEKPGTLVVELDVTTTSALSYAQVDFCNDSNTDTFYEFCYNLYEVEGNIYTFEIPISQNRHLGDWQIQDIRLYDTSGRMAHYTNQTVSGYFADYYNASVTLPLLKFEVTGEQGDETEPAITGIRVLNNDGAVDKPGILKVELDLVEDGSGITAIEVYYKRIDTNNDIDVSNWLTYYYYAKGYELPYNMEFTSMKSPLKTGTYTFEIPVYSTKANGKYQVCVSLLQDAAENKYEDHVCEGPRAEFTVIDEFSYAFEMGITNGSLLSAIQSMQSGEVGRIMLGTVTEDNVLKKEMLDAIAGQNKTLICYRDGYQWIFDGKKIDPAKTKDLNLTATISLIPGHKLSSGKQAVCLSFENNGQLPGKVEFRFKSAFVKDYFGGEDRLHLFHVEGPESGHEVGIDYKNSDYKEIPHKDANFKVVLDDKDSWCYVDLTHNSKYIVSGETIVKYSEQQTNQQNNTQQTTVPATTAPQTTTVPETTAPDTTVPETSSSAVPETTHSTPGATASQAAPENTEDPDEPQPTGIVAVIVICLIAVAAAALALTNKQVRDRLKALLEKIKKAQ